MRLVPDDEDDVCWDFVGSLVTFPLESDLSPGLPSGFDIDCKNFLFFANASIVADNSPEGEGEKASN